MFEPIITYFNRRYGGKRFTVEHKYWRNPSLYSVVFTTNASSTHIYIDFYVNDPNFIYAPVRADISRLFANYFNIPYTRLTFRSFVVETEKSINDITDFFID